MKKKQIHFEREYLSVWNAHDDVSCKALRAYEQSPLKKNAKLMTTIAEKYGTTISEMKKHRRCINEDRN